MPVDNVGLVSFTENEICELLYQNPSLDFDKFMLVDPEKYNTANRLLHCGFKKLTKYHPLEQTQNQFDKANQERWFLPREYENFDIKDWLIQQCQNQEQLDRVNLELALFEQTNLLNLVKYLKYLTDTMIKNDIVWGVGRGSSTASYVLYLIGLHLIDPIKYDIPIEEFFKKGN